MAGIKDLAISRRFYPYIKNRNEIAASYDCLPFVGRQKEIEMVVETLIRQWKNNPVLVGKPGVGKTALVTEVAARINRKEVPPYLRGKTILELSVNAFVYSRESPEKLAREFEEFFLELKQNQQRIILFLDEIQFPALSSNFGRDSFPQLSNLLKNHLASRDLTVIATATPEEYVEYVKSDEILSSCFEVLFIPEPTRREMHRILTGVKRHFESYYSLQIPEQLLQRIYPLAQRFNPSRAFPDKAIELLDISCSKAAVQKKGQLGIEEVYESLGSISKLPVAIVKKNQRRHFLGLQAFLESELVNQKEALEEISRVLKIFNMVRGPESSRPLGIMLFLGPAGIGKSLIAGKVSQYLFGSRDKLRIIRLSNLKKANDYEKLIAPGEGRQQGLLVSELENHPFSIILFENVGEAHEGVLSFLSRTITKGELIDATGKKHDLSNIIFILSLTSIGEVQKRESAIGFEKMDGQETQIVIDPKIMSVLDWVDEIIQFAPLTFEHLRMIAQQEAEAAIVELTQQFNCCLKIDVRVLDAIAQEAEKSGRFAHFVTEMVERQIRMRAMDLIVGTRQKVCYAVKLKNGRIIFEEEGESQPAEGKKDAKAAK